MRFATFTRAVRVHIHHIDSKCELLNIHAKKSHTRSTKECIDEGHEIPSKKSMFLNKRRLGRSLYNLVHALKSDLFKQSSVDDNPIGWHCSVESDKVRMRNTFDGASNWIPPNFFHDRPRSSLCVRPLSYQASISDFSSSSDISKKSSRSSYLRHSSKPSWSSDDTIITSCPNDGITTRLIDRKQSSLQELDIKAQTKRKLRRFTFAGPTYSRLNV
ncbi:hypothetical protein BDF22DRAFT_740068 [Syncephalis plumigaleata]|nr:hypothetical protein BDF22DRAFT_740068 [Syncephalis plumigaleata]